MITKEQILNAGSAALSQAFQRWLNDNRQELIETIAHQLASKTPATMPQNRRTETPPRPYLTPAQVASRWGCCVQTVLRKTRSGALTCLMMNRRHILIPLEAIMKFEKDATVP